LDGSMAGNPVLMLRSRRKKISSPPQKPSPPRFLPAIAPSGGSRKGETDPAPMVPVPPKISPPAGPHASHRRKHLSLPQEELHTGAALKPSAPPGIGDTTVILLSARRKKMGDKTPLAAPAPCDVGQLIIDGV
ncbi:hypothetical protein HDU91_003985, partial [Kappamyces sp. JEL0680]